MIVLGRMAVLSEEVLLWLTEDEVVALDFSPGVVVTTKRGAEFDGDKVGQSHARFPKKAHISANTHIAS